ncbi:hypothetical protein Jann_2278 [Jannaschia sp. CCS1]|nr:hypothetical protein Jann_2278 [Jannaschia sp. CCS1]
MHLLRWIYTVTLHFSCGFHSESPDTRTQIAALFCHLSPGDSSWRSAQYAAREVSGDRCGPAWRYSGQKFSAFVQKLNRTETRRTRERTEVRPIVRQLRENRS